MFKTHSVLGVTTALVVLFMLAPLIVVIMSAFSATGYMTFPPGTLSLRWFVACLTDPDWLITFLITALLSFIAACGSVLLGFLTALVATRRAKRSRGFIEFLILLPVAFPHAALAVAILAVVSTFGLVGTFAGVLLAHVMISLPFAYRPIAASFAKLDIANEEAAMSLGATPWTVFRRVTLPLIRPGLITAMLFCFMLSFDEVTITLFLVGPNFTTLPIKIFAQLQDNASPIIAAVSTILIILTTSIVLLMNRVFGLELYVEPERPK